MIDLKFVKNVILLGNITGGLFSIDIYGRKGVSQPSLMIGISQQKIVAPTDLFGPKQNFSSLTV